MVNPYLSCLQAGKPTARNAEWGAGMGTQKKRMPSCNGADRSFNVTPPRKRADFCEVTLYKKLCRTF
ncbi:hypothetical protein EAI27_11615 [Alistipes onderdonkii]|uniref:hypothetical protein n=1 Tax=uncultured Bacteroides sp. TaxID=162156 RepID=UPI000E46841D|nr:hypothetical protein [uncultured Bacteroides sp.]KAA2442057.1 hypothetical protein F2X58_11080 [Alistipes onderdonkii]KAA2480841.1 hypothetical protein F2Y01_09530 [Alistipes onderdonkii]KAA2483488.1 hypothetical protein F2X59_12850 [Alistipes onderdonkii]KAA2495154.1 hypothetical protein F2X56_10780 [Alistipes onderdonkii]KAA2535428.1 hypothetical protein F2S44_13085 [Alistipes onderdonkii]